MIIFILICFITALIALLLTVLLSSIMRKVAEKMIPDLKERMQGKKQLGDILGRLLASLSNIIIPFFFWGAALSLCSLAADFHLGDSRYWGYFFIILLFSLLNAMLQRTINRFVQEAKESSNKIGLKKVKSYGKMVYLNTKELNLSFIFGLLIMSIFSTTICLIPSVRSIFYFLLFGLDSIFTKI